MGIKNLAKVLKASFGKYLYRSVCVLLILTAITSWSVSGLYARYITSADVNGSSQVANEGITTFELMEHKLKDPGTLTTEEISYIVKNNTLSVLTAQEIQSAQTTYWAPPGVDIPKDPFIRLNIKAGVSYELYVKVTKSENFPDNVYCVLAESWEPVSQANGVYTYKYVVNPSSSGADKYIFAAGNTYNYDGNNVIKILKGDKIHVGEDYSIVKDNENLVTFSIKFDAYIRQAIHTS